MSCDFGSFTSGFFLLFEKYLLYGSACLNNVSDHTYLMFFYIKKSSMIQFFLFDFCVLLLCQAMPFSNNN